MQNSRSADVLQTPYVTATLTYLLNTGEKPINFPSTADGQDERNTGIAADHNVTVHNARLRPEQFSLDCQGFMLTEHRSSVHDFYDDAELTETHVAEVSELLRSLTGAREVAVFDHTRRSDSPELRRQRKIRDPASTVHNDHTDRSAPQRVRDCLNAEAERLLRGRFAIINVWRSIAGAVQTSPIALCDARSVEQKDLIPTERRAANRIGETYRLAFSDKHEWFYYPLIQPDEALIIKTYDSAHDGRARFAPHTAFNDPTAAADAPPRESAESRAFVFF